MPVPGKTGFFRTVEHGVLTGRSARSASPHGRTTLWPASRHARAGNGHDDDARALWNLWRPSALTRAEKEAFGTALFNEGTIGDYSTAIGRRSSTLALARFHLKRAAVPLSLAEVRRGMFLSQSPERHPYNVPPELQTARRQWIILQMRQLQRLALETLLSWCEKQIMEGREDTATLVQMFESAWHDADFGLGEGASLSEILQQLGQRFYPKSCLSRAAEQGTCRRPSLTDGRDTRRTRRRKRKTRAALLLRCVAVCGICRLQRWR